MPFARPTLTELIDRVRGDFRSRLSITGSLLRRATADVLANVWAGLAHMQHAHLEWAADQNFADTAEDEFMVRRAAVWGLNRTPATFAQGTVDGTGTGTPTIPTGAVWVRDDGATFTSDSDETIAGGVFSAAVTAVLAGVDGNTPAGDTLSLQAPIAGVDTDAIIDANEIADGNEQETIDELRVRYLLRLQTPPQGGNEQDYEGWALAVAGVTRAWIYENEGGLGIVKIRFVRDNESPIFPSGGEVTTVQTAIDAERPVTADAIVEAPVDDPIAMTIDTTPSGTAIETAVTAELNDLFFRAAEPGDGAGRGTVLLSQILVAVGIAEGVTDFDVSVPAANVVPALGDLPTVGTITYGAL